ncbi:MAG: nicotinate-nucleotide--dimethylbenzimidazole phosphoribosyltransferase [Acidimicrobiia bacterium]
MGPSAFPEEEAVGGFQAAAAAVRGLDPVAVAAAEELQERLTKPRGSLGRLEQLGAQLAGIAGACPPPLPSPAVVVVFAGDHGVVAEGVTPWPQEVTAQMVANFVAGGAAINVLARQAGASVRVVDVGVAMPLPPGREGAPLLVRRNLGPGTANLARAAAMSLEDALRALDIGVEVASEAVASGAGALITGEMGIGNTTPAAALVAALCGRQAREVTGRGTGIDDAGLERKTAVIERALELHREAIASGPLSTLAALGGYEIAALAGFVVGGAAAGIPVLVDGLIAGAALLVAERLAPGTAARCIAGHRSVEPGATAVLQTLGMEPVLDLGMRLGEGTGACLSLAVVEAAARVLREMATFDAAGVSDKRQ